MGRSRIAIMRVVVVTPEQFLGDVIGDLDARAGRITKIAPVGELQGVLAFVRMTELHGYPSALAHNTRGQARCEIRFSHYEADGDDSDEGPAVPSPLKPSPPAHSGRAAAMPPRAPLD